MCAFKYGYAYKCEYVCEPVDGRGFSRQRAWGKWSVREKGQEHGTGEWMSGRGWELYGGQKKTESS